MSDTQIEISAGDVVVTAVLNGTDTADELWDVLPITGRAQTWGDEIYVSIPGGAEEEAVASKEVGGAANRAPPSSLTPPLPGH